ncbi:protein DpdJ [Streptomyces hainanensis]|uniref:DEAD/DEAH box helicase n=1 Tax=Streptomyces hainanensis TaxID=402648 RepID=A0A4R4TT14_9ACTN|nr:protein DpdJ [Streptomyces hainanensis]TDC79154.1 DEAD/DEAH box helicase [Streptomyces hainanensis]
MTRDYSSDFLGQVLNDLEDLELQLLSWGITTGSISADEVFAAIDRTLATHKQAPPGATPDDVREALLARALLFRVPRTSPPVYRTRIAEALRLTVQLRQHFPRWRPPDDPPAGWWRSSPRLVADYRLHAPRRRYPKPEVPAEEALAALAGVRGWGKVQERVASVQIGDLRLARFQLDAAVAVYDSLSRRQSRGVIVGAGTGSGKTLAFYLPAFAAMAESLRQGRHRVHTLALYPRNELLRDQLRTALITAKTVEPVLLGEDRRPLRIGALYGNTPQSASRLRASRHSQASGQAWARRGDGFICPYLNCPMCDTGELIWLDTDRKAGRERLCCQNCEAAIPEGRLALTRESMRRQPPDLLFTTTEMLNRQSANPDLGPLLGWSGVSRPSLVLLDEVHIQSGPQGAQTALLLRRWRHAVGRPVTFVGLSATLKEARRFFAQLTGLSELDVEYVEPDPRAMVEKGREYAIALRGDPLSNASLLSTSLQTAMLFGRMLDPIPVNERRDSLFGSTGFLFTDALDITNRLYDYLRDAEGGQTRWGRGRGHPVLAALRSPDLPEQHDRYQEGQSWDLAEKIGHSLHKLLTGQALRIGRTSSQDAGVSAEANLIVATASLEVGFNDPRVGLVLQHKAPHDAAAFIQRRGRAGRQRGSRPITVVVLSDYGRDRLAYQGYEALFAPELTSRNLPVGNRHVLKIQAAQVLLDWLGRDLHRVYPKADPRFLLHGARAAQRADVEGRPRFWLAERLQALLEDRDDLRVDLARFLAAALKVDADTVQAVMWEQPRSLMLAVAPTALRRLRSAWNPVGSDPGADRDAVLPEFITPALFEQLNVPDVEFALPFETFDAEPERLAIESALREAVPGRVSRRFGFRRDDHRTWLPVPDGQDTLQVKEVAQGVEEGEWTAYGHRQRLRVLRPYRIELAAPPAQVTDYSQGRPRWGTEILSPPSTDTSEALVPQIAPWRHRIKSLEFHTHADGNPIEVRRMTYGAECAIGRRGRPTERRTVRYVAGAPPVPAALGYRLEVDAVQLRAAPLDPSASAVHQHLVSPAWRTKAFFHAVKEDPELSTVANSFQRDWLALVYLTAFALEGLDGGQEPEKIYRGLADGSWRNRLPQILSVLYREDESSGEETSTETGAARASRIDELSQVSRMPAVLNALQRAGQLLITNDIAERTAELARRSYWDTLASAVLEASLRACPDAQDGDLIVDVQPNPDEGGTATIWLSETSVGGLGVVEHLVRHYGEDPRRFWSQVASALRPNQYEYTDSSLTRLLEHLIHEEPSGEAATAIATLRSPTSAADADRALEHLRAAWSRLDGPPRHSAVAALSTRLLRPGSSRETDGLALRLVNEWTALEERLGFEVDARVIAFVVGTGQLDLGGVRSLSADQAFSLLWPRGDRARNHHLECYQPFLDLDRPMVLDRLLAAAAHDEQLPRLTVTDEGWEPQYQQAIADSGAVELICPATDRRALAEAMARVPALRVDHDVLRIHGAVVAVSRHEDEFRCRVELAEAEQ